MTKVKYIPKPYTLRPMNKKDLRELLGISKHVLNTWLKSIEEELGDPLCNLYSIRQVEFIIERFGVPGQLIIEKEIIKNKAA